MKHAIISPIISENDKWESYKDTYLYKLFLNTLVKTYTTRYKNENLYTTVYISYNNDNKIYSNEDERKHIIDFINNYRNIECKFILIDDYIYTNILNGLGKVAYDDGCDYFYICNDSTLFYTKHWDIECIELLDKNNNIGYVETKSIFKTFMYPRLHIDFLGKIMLEDLPYNNYDDWGYNIFLSKYKLERHTFGFYNDCIQTKYYIFDISNNVNMYLNNNNYYYKLKDYIFKNKLKYTKKIGKIIDNTCIFQDYPLTNNEDDPIYLITQFYIDKDRERQKEIVSCLKRNIKLNIFKFIILLCERRYTKEELEIDDNEYRNVLQIVIKKRMTYADAFLIIKQLKLKGYMCVANSDIFFDNTINNLHHTCLSYRKSCFCLLRIDYIKDKKLEDHKLDKLQNWSQDVWILHSNFLPKDNLKKYNYKLGIPGCDHIILNKLYNDGFICYNYPYMIRTYHYHTSNIRNYTHDNRYKDDYLFIKPRIYSKKTFNNTEYLSKKCINLVCYEIIYLKALLMLVQTIYNYGNLDSNTDIVIHTTSEIKKIIEKTPYNNKKLKYVIKDDDDTNQHICDYEDTLDIDLHSIVKGDLNKIFNTPKEDREQHISYNDTDVYSDCVIHKFTYHTYNEILNFFKEYDNLY